MIQDEVFKAAWAKLTPFKLPSIQNSFFDNSPTYRKFMSEDLGKSLLDPIHVDGTASSSMSLPQGADAAYIIPYMTPEGQFAVDDQGILAMYRMRLRRPQHSKESRYTQPTGEMLNKNGLPAFMPYIHPLTLELPGDTLVCAEGEKKTVSIIRHLGLPAFGIGGYQMWRDPSGSGGVHPWIKRILAIRGTKKILIVPDGDLFRYDICSGYGTFAHTLRQEGYDVEVCNPKGKVDDLIAEWGCNARDRFGALEKVSIDGLVQSHSLLSKRYDLAFRETKDGGVILHQTSSNVMKLLEEHQSFPKIWRNQDDNRVYVGTEQAQPELTEMNIANYFQHNLKMERVNSRMIFQCAQALSKKNQRSPFLDYIKRQIWDGTERLETWLHRLWGVEDTDFTRQVASKWLVSACARLSKPGTKIDWMFVVVGAQRTGKTSMPSVLFNGNSLTLYGDSSDKDLHMKFHSALVIGFDELDSFGRRESSFLKAMISTPVDYFRPPYGASVEVFSRRFTLYGCGNRADYLQSDPSGYRRYPTIEVKQLLNFKGLESERDQLWAEAWHWYQNKDVSYWEVDGASEEAEKFTAPNLLEEEIENYLDLARKNPSNIKDGFLYTRFSVMIPQLNSKNPNTKDVAAILRKLGAERHKGRGPFERDRVIEWWRFPFP